MKPRRGGGVDLTQNTAQPRALAVPGELPLARPSVDLAAPASADVRGTDDWQVDVGVRWAQVGLY